MSARNRTQNLDKQIPVHTVKLENMLDAFVILGNKVHSAIPNY